MRGNPNHFIELKLRELERQDLSCQLSGLEARPRSVNSVGEIWRLRFR